MSTIKELAKQAALSDLLKNKAVRGGLIGAGVGGLGGLAAEKLLPKREDDDTPSWKLPLLAALTGGSAGTLTGIVEQGGVRRPGIMDEHLQLLRQQIDNQARWR